MATDREVKGDPEEAARLRAAFAYADLSKPERAKILRVSERTVTRIEAAESVMPRDRWDAVLEATGIPPWFAQTGFQVPPEPEEPGIAERLEALERQVGALIRRLGDDAPAQPPDELLRMPEDLRSTSHRKPGGETRPGTGEQRGTGR